MKNIKIFCIVVIGLLTTGFSHIAYIHVGGDLNKTKFYLSAKSIIGAGAPCITDVSLARVENDGLTHIWLAANKGRCQPIEVIVYGHAPNGFEERKKSEVLVSGTEYIFSVGTGAFSGFCRFRWLNDHFVEEGNLCN